MPTYDVEIKVTMRVDANTQELAEQDAWAFVAVALDADGRPLIPGANELMDVKGIETQAVEPVNDNLAFGLWAAAVEGGKE